MPFTVERIDEVPGLVSTFTGTITLEEFERWWPSVVETAQPIPEAFFYHILNAGSSTASFNAVIGIFRQQLSPESPFRVPGKDRITPIIVGKNPMMRFTAHLAAQQQLDGFTLPFFKTMDAALEYIRADIRKRAQGG